jgi:hypothetical protein
MDFKFLKDKVINASIEAKNGIVKTTDKAVSFGATKLSNS